jgi:hypothetical protein
MEVASNWRISLHEISTPDGVRVPAGATLIVGDSIQQCDQIIFDPKTNSPLVLANNRLIRLARPHASWWKTLRRAGIPVRSYLTRLSHILDDIQRLDTAVVH